MVHIGDDQVPARAQHPGELGQYRIDAGNVHECEHGDDHIRRIIRQRQPVQAESWQRSARSH